MTLNAIDATLQAVTPTVMVPRHEPFRPMTECGHRFLVARDGLWLEVKRPWVAAVLPLALQDNVAMPYGWLKSFVDLRCGRVPAHVVTAFVSYAMRTPDIEVAGGAIWNEETGNWRFQAFEAIESSGEHIHYKRPDLTNVEHLVIDMHSHGHGRAFFSHTDNDDDRGEVKLAMVFGHVGGANGPEIMVRLCAMGLFRSMDPNDLYALPEIVHA